jgi:hypothetical protein
VGEPAGDVGEPAQTVGSGAALSGCGSRLGWTGADPEPVEPGAGDEAMHGTSIGS